MNPRTKGRMTFAMPVLALVCLLSCLQYVWPRDAGAVPARAHAAPAVKRPRHAPARRRVPECRPNTRSVASLPAPLVSFVSPYRPGRCDPMHLLPVQARRMFACVRWREGGDTPNESNGAGMYQFTNRATWNEFRGAFPEVPSDATALQQDIVAYRVWKVEQFFPWNGDPCLGQLQQYGKWGWY